MTASIVNELHWIPMSPNLAATVQRAGNYAAAQSHVEVTLEHLLLALTEDDDAAVILATNNIDAAHLKGEVSIHLGRIENRFQSGEAGSAIVSSDLNRILSAATEAAKGRRSEINGAIVLAAIVGDGKSTAAHLLEAQGLTFEDAIRVLQTATPSTQTEGTAAGTTPSSNNQDVPQSRPVTSTDDILAQARDRVATRTPTVGKPPPSKAAEREVTARDVPVVKLEQREEQDSPPSRPFESSPATDESSRSASLGFDKYQQSKVPEAATPPPTPPPQRPPPPPPAPPAARPAAPARPGEQHPAAQGIGAAPAAPQRAKSPFEPPVFPPQQPATPPPTQGNHGRTTPPGINAPPKAQPPPRPPGAPALNVPTRRPADPGANFGGPAAPAPLSVGSAHTGVVHDPRRPPAPAPPPRQQGSLPPQSRQTQRRAEPALSTTGSAPTKQQPQPAPARKKSKSRGKNIEAGQMVENIPRAMRVDVSQMVEIRLAKAHVPAVGSGMQGTSPTYRHELLVTNAMTVRLRAPDGGFFIETASPETQWIENSLGMDSDDYASWRWTVTPNERGKKRLQVIVSARTVGIDGLAAESALPDRVFDVRVRTNYSKSFKRVAGWTFAAIGGGLLARFGEQIWVYGSKLIQLVMPG